jgi:hypothetical protein
MARATPSQTLHPSSTRQLHAVKVSKINEIVERKLTNTEGEKSNRKVLDGVHIGLKLA